MSAAWAQSPSSLDRLADALTPPAAIAAYRDAIAQNPDSLVARRFFVRRMADFGVPYAAEVQARELVQRDPRDGLAWAVLASARASLGDGVRALHNIVLAVRYAPTDAFVGRTAGRLLAWFDTDVDARRISPQLRRALQAVRERLRDTEPFASTYWARRESHAMRTPEPAPAGPEVQAPLPAEGRAVRSGQAMVAARSFAQRVPPEVGPPLPRQPFPPRTSPHPRVKQPVVEPSVPLTRPPAYTMNGPRRP